MRHSALFVALFFAILSACIMAQKSHGHENSHIHRPTSPQAMLIKETEEDKMVDQFKSLASANPKIKHQQEKETLDFVQREETQKGLGIYEPFEQNEEVQQQIKDQDEGYYQQFNELLKWGMIIGSVFLIFVLLKSCTRKNERKYLRKIGQQTVQKMVPTQQQMRYYVVQPQPVNPVIINPNRFQDQQSLEKKIMNAEIQLNKLKAIQQKQLQNEFNKKKMDEEKRRVEAINAQRNNVLERSRRAPIHWNIGYGPAFYGQQQSNLVRQQQANYTNEKQQPFQVQGIEPIRPRSNSFKTENSQRPIISQEVKYRNGIPIGKPIRQHDNDSSFASEYPEV